MEPVDAQTLSLELGLGELVPPPVVERSREPTVALLLRLWAEVGQRLDELGERRGRPEGRD
jgi:hypothetical protein